MKYTVDDIKDARLMVGRPGRECHQDNDNIEKPMTGEFEFSFYTGDRDFHTCTVKVDVSMKEVVKAFNDKLKKEREDKLEEAENILKELNVAYEIKDVEGWRFMEGVGLVFDPSVFPDDGLSNCIQNFDPLYEEDEGISRTWKLEGYRVTRPKC